MKVVKLQEIADVKLGRQRSPKNHFGDSMRPYLRSANVGWEGLDLDDVKLMNFTDAEMRIFKLQSGDLLLNEGSGSAAEVGKPAIWNGELEDCAFQNTLLRVRPKRELVDVRYLLHYFSWQARSGGFARGSRGVGIFHLGRGALATWPVPLPRLEEQCRISAILDRTGELRAKRSRVIESFRVAELRMFDSLFGPADAPKLDLAEIAYVTSGLTKGRKPRCETWPVPYLAVANVQAGYLSLGSVKNIEATREEIDRYSLRSGDLLLTEGGDPDKLGRGTLWADELPVCIHQNHVFRVRLKANASILPGYLAAYTAHPEARSYFLRSAKQTTGIASINSSQLKALPVRMPPLALQALPETECR